MAIFIDVHQTREVDIEKGLADLPACNGTGLFLDITSSTEIKYKKGFKDWIVLLKNTFNILELQDKIKNNIIKYIGDEIMIFIPDDVLLSEDLSIYNYYTLLQEIFATVDILKMLHMEKVHMKCKVAIHYCKEVYNITFFKGYNDYYGKDIDLSARLLSKADENEIVISELFYQKVLMDLEEKQMPGTSGCLEHVSETQYGVFKGIPHSIPFRMLSA